MISRILLGGLAVLGMSGTANAALVYGVDELNNLVSYNTAALGSGTAPLSSVAITGLADSLQAIDFRPLNGVLYGLGSENTIYTINTGTGIATAVSSPLALTGTSFAFDFNPTIDRLRIVSNTNQNYVFNPNDGSLTNATDVFYQADPSVDPDIVAAAYVPAAFGAPASAAPLFVIDSRNNALARQGNSTGVLTPVGLLGTDVGTRVGFDIAGNEAIAFNGNTFYSVNLGTGALTALGTTDRQLFGIAAVPEPASWGFMILGLGAAGSVLRRRARYVPKAA